VTQLYRETKTTGLPILPLVMDIRNPSPGRGVCNETFAAASERLSCEMVVALDLVHRLVIKRRLNFDQIAASFSAFSAKWLVVEFAPGDDPEVRDSWSDDHRDWYTLEGFKVSLGKHYRTIRVVRSSPEPRVLLICAK
jgi:hypothetical protein